MEARTAGASGDTITLADETELAVDAVIWATGFDLDHSWIELPVRAADGGIFHRRGVTDIPGLYFLGLPWQHTRGSALLGWVKDDAEHIAAQIAMSPVPASSSLEVAVRIAARQNVDMKMIKDWSQRERAVSRFEAFLEELERFRRRSRRKTGKIR